MRGFVAITTIALFLGSWVPDVCGQDIFEINPVSRTISVSASCNGTVSDELHVGPVYLERSCTAKASIDTWGSPSNPDEPISAEGSITIRTSLVPNVVQLSAASHFASGYSTGLPSSFLGDASIVFTIPARAEPHFEFTPLGFADCIATLNGPTGQLWRALGTGIAQLHSESETPPFLDPGQYTLSMHIQPRIAASTGGDGGMTLKLTLAPAVPEPLGIGLISLSLALLPRPALRSHVS